jgi:hypothetical protein
MQFQFDINFIGTFILPLISTVISVVIFLVQKTKKRIGYEIVSTAPLPTFDKPASELKNPANEIVIKYTNTGNTALEETDFHFPVSTTFIDAEILDVQIRRTAYDSNVAGELTRAKNSVSFKPDLMNPADSILLVFKIHNFQRKIHIETKIKNGKQVYNKALYDLFFERFWLLAALYFGLYIRNSMITKTLNSGPDLKLFLILTFPFIAVSLLHIYRKLRTQYVLYFVWEVP